IGRREFLIAAGTLATCSPVSAALAAPRTSADAPGPDRTVHFLGDGLALSPSGHARLLLELTRNAAVEVDDYSRGGAVARLEGRMAALLGKEAAVFLPTGTLANHLAIRLLARGGRRVLVQRESHLYCDSGDGAQELSGLTLVPLAPGKATFTLAEVQAEIARAESGRVATAVGAVSIESPVRRLAGENFDFDEMRRIAAHAKARGIGLHLDGARLLIASAYTGIAPATYAGHFDTVFVSLWKYLNASSGAILAGPRHLLADLHHARRMFGGGLPYAWPHAVVASHYLGGFGERFARAVGASEEILRTLRRHPRCRIERPGAGTNVAQLSVTGADAAALPERLREHGILIGEAWHASSEGAEFVLITNESILRRPAAELIGAFASALA
ncbi:MAG: threonine aldolase family protein, partial [Pseudomonadota bacterium]|nr:threonine aldolase family protein [Pseudomonadota bacterium]